MELQGLGKKLQLCSMAVLQVGSRDKEGCRPFLATDLNAQLPEASWFSLAVTILIPSSTWCYSNSFCTWEKTSQLYCSPHKCQSPCHGDTGSSSKSLENGHRQHQDPSPSVVQTTLKRCWMKNWVHFQKKAKERFFGSDEYVNSYVFENFWGHSRSVAFPIDSV